MSLIRSLPRLHPTPHLEAPRVWLRYPKIGDYLAWASLRTDSRAFLTPYEPTWAADELTRPAYRRRLRAYQRDVRTDMGYAFFIFKKETGGLLGGARLSNVRRGVAQACSLGYWIGAAHAGKGYMAETVRTLIPFVFGELKLHRLEAACVPENERSTRLLKSTGFREEGLARNYLRINGEWRDHVLFALLAEDVA